MTDLLIHSVETKGCSEQEIDALNQLVLAHTQKKLPTAYREFLEYAGHGVGNLLSGMGFKYQQTISRMKFVYENIGRDGTFKICEQEGIIPNNALLFGYKESHPNQYLFLLLEEIENPLVYEWWVGEDRYIHSGLTFTEYMLKGIGYSEVLHQKIPIEYRAILFFVKEKVFNIITKIPESPSLIWELLLDDLNSFLQKVYQMVWNSNDENRKAYAEFKDVFLQLLTMILPRIVEKEGNSALIANIENELISIIEYLSFVPKDNDYDVLDCLKDKLVRSTDNIGVKKLSEGAFFNHWDEEEVDINHRDKQIRIRAKWFYPQLMYYYNKM